MQKQCIKWASKRAHLHYEVETKRAPCPTLAKNGHIGATKSLPLCRCLWRAKKAPCLLIWGLQKNCSKEVNFQIQNLWPMKVDCTRNAYGVLLSTFIPEGGDSQTLHILPMASVGPFLNGFSPSQETAENQCNWCFLPTTTIHSAASRTFMCHMLCKGLREARDEWDMVSTWVSAQGPLLLEIKEASKALVILFSCN